MTLRSPRDRIADVRRLQGAARALLAERASLVPALVASTGLSTEGVELALSRHVEVSATEAELATLVTRAGHTSRVAVVLSANVFVGALRAVALARAASIDVVVRPSRRDPAFARALVHAARASGDHCVRLDESLDVASIDDGELHVYGTDETIAELRKQARVPVRGHGSGMGIAWISDRAVLEEAALALAEDVVVFDQRGCLSPRVALVHGDGARAAELAEALHAELERCATRVPRGEISATERAASNRYIATMTYASRALVGRAHAIGVSPRGAPLLLPPAYRHVHVVACPSLSAAADLVGPIRKGILTVGSDEPDAAAELAPAWARVARLGAMQRPPLDGPVDLRDL